MRIIRIWASACNFVDFEKDEKSIDRLMYIKNEENRCFFISNYCNTFACYSTFQFFKKSKKSKNSILPPHSCILRQSNLVKQALTGLVSEFIAIKKSRRERSPSLGVYFLLHSKGVRI